MKRILTLFMIAVFVCASTIYAQTPATPTQNPTPAKKDEDCGCDIKLPEGRVAIVNGIKVTVQEIDEPIKDKIKELQEQIIESRKNEVDLLINARLLDIEAKKRGVSAEKILQTDVESKLIEPTDAEAQRFYQQNADKLQGSFNDLKPNILAYLRAERMRIQAKKLADQLRATAQVKIVGQATPPA